MYQNGVCTVVAQSVINAFDTWGCSATEGGIQTRKDLHLVVGIIPIQPIPPIRSKHARTSHFYEILTF